MMEHTFSCAECGVLREAEIEPMALSEKNMLKSKKPCPVCKNPYVKSANSMTPEERKNYIERNSILKMAAQNKEDKSVQNSLADEEIQAQNEGEGEGEAEAIAKDKYEMERGEE